MSHFNRANNIIFNPASNQALVCTSINQAKRVSRAFQSRGHTVSRVDSIPRGAVFSDVATSKLAKLESSYFFTAAANILEG